MPRFKRGTLFVVSAPSGVGKTTLVRSILSRSPALRFSVSCTTRSPRPGETPSIDYHFLSTREFLDGIRSGRFLEWAEVHGNYYGTDGLQVEQWLADGEDVLLDIDVQGARQVRCTHPEARTIFILPPSLQILEDRLKGRGTERPEDVQRRLSAARGEILEAPWYQYIVVNDLLEDAIEDLMAILRSARCELTSAAPRLAALLKSVVPFKG